MSATLLAVDLDIPYRRFQVNELHPNHGQRVVNGYRLTQPPSDMFLGWTSAKLAGHHYFVRQLRDIKIGIRVETFRGPEMKLYATCCGRAFARSHARSGSAHLSYYFVRRP